MLQGWIPVISFTACRYGVGVRVLDIYVLEEG